MLKITAITKGKYVYFDKLIISLKLVSRLCSESVPNYGTQRRNVKQKFWEEKIQINKS